MMEHPSEPDNFYGSQPNLTDNASYIDDDDDDEEQISGWESFKRGVRGKYSTLHPNMLL